METSGNHFNATDSTEVHDGSPVYNQPAQPEMSAAEFEEMMDAEIANGNMGRAYN
jgi:hypothetical protein